MRPATLVSFALLTIAGCDESGRVTSNVRSLPSQTPETPRPGGIRHAAWGRWLQEEYPNIENDYDLHALYFPPSPTVVGVRAFDSHRFLNDVSRHAPSALALASRDPNVCGKISGVAKVTPLQVAAFNGNLDFVGACLKGRIDVLKKVRGLSMIELALLGFYANPLFGTEDLKYHNILVNETKGFPYRFPTTWKEVYSANTLPTAADYGNILRLLLRYAQATVKTDGAPMPDTYPVAHVFMQPANAEGHVIRAVEALFVDAAEALVEVGGVDLIQGTDALIHMICRMGSTPLHDLLWRFKDQDESLAVHMALGRFMGLGERALLPTRRSGGRSDGTNESRTGDNGLYGFEAVFEGMSPFEPLYTRMTHFMLRHGANLDSVDPHGRTALHIAAKAGYTEIVEALVDAGANLGVREPATGFTACHLAVIWGRTEVAKILHKAGAANALDLVGRSPLELARLHADTATTAALTTRTEVEVNAAGEGKGRAEGGRMEAIASEADPSCDFTVLEAIHITRRSFARDFLAINRPVAIRGGVEHWPAVERWADREYFQSLGGKKGCDRHDGGGEGGPGSGNDKECAGAGVELKFPTSLIPYQKNFGLEEPLTMTLRDYFTYLDEQQGAAPKNEMEGLYMFYHMHEGSKNEGLRRMLSRILNDTTRSDINGGDELLVVPTDSDAGYQLSLGGHLSGAPYHHHRAAWNGLVVGEREWSFLRPRDAVYSRAMSNAAPHYPPHLELTCTQRAGDLIFVPEGWSHRTLNKSPLALGLSQEIESAASSFRRGWAW